MTSWIQRSKRRLWGAYAYIFAAMLCLVWLVSRSIYSQSPVQSADVVIFVSHGDHGLILTEIRKYVGNREESLSVGRYLFKESDPTKYFVVEGGNFTALVGEFPVLHTSVLPTWVKGRWCTGMALTWWPDWTLRSYSMKTKDVCFETTEYE